MTGKHSRWVRVNRQTLCPICNKPDNCEVLLDGTWVWCGRVSDGAIRRNNGGQFLHRLTEDWRQPVGQSAPELLKRPGKDFSAEAERWFGIAAAEEERSRLARQLGVSNLALERLRVGWNPNRRWWTIPERDAIGTIVGLSTRTESGVKKRRTGGRAGLTYADDWDQPLGPVLLPEGASDTAAIMTIGLCGVGRPSNLGGVDHLIGLLEDLPLDRDVVVLAERDQKPNGRWPGRDGAVSTAAQLAEALSRPIGWSLPPDEAKDARSWLNSVPATLPTSRKADLFVSGLAITWVQPIPRITPPVPVGPAIELSVWRERMLQARLDSLKAPGTYVDASPTGAGKSFVDLQILRHFGSPGAV